MNIMYRINIYKEREREGEKFLESVCMPSHLLAVCL